MGYIGTQPTNPLNDGDVTSAKIADGAIVEADLNSVVASPILLATATASASATIEFDSGIDFTAYQAYRIEMTEVVVSNDAISLYLRQSTDGGTTYDSTGDYDGTISKTESGSASITNTSSSAANQCTIMDNIGNASGEGAAGYIEIFTPSNSTLAQLIQFRCTSIRDTGAVKYYRGVYRHKTAAQDTDGFRLYPSAGTITSGTFKLYGLR